MTTRREAMTIGAKAAVVDIAERIAGMKKAAIDNPVNIEGCEGESREGTQAAADFFRGGVIDGLSMALEIIEDYARDLAALEAQQASCLPAVDALSKLVPGPEGESS